MYGYIQYICILFHLHFFFYSSNTTISYTVAPESHESKAHLQFWARGTEQPLSHTQQTHPESPLNAPPPSFRCDISAVSVLIVTCGTVQSYTHTQMRTHTWELLEWKGSFTMHDPLWLREPPVLLGQWRKEMSLSAINNPLNISVGRHSAAALLIVIPPTPQGGSVCRSGICVSGAIPDITMNGPQPGWHHCVWRYR